MSLGSILRDIFTDYTVRSVTLGALSLGIISGVLGTFAVLRKQSLLGDAISHATLPGIALAFILLGTKSQVLFLLGALAAGWVATLLFMSIIRRTILKSDSALGIVLSVFFGFGIVLLTWIQNKPNAAQSGIEHFLFGQAAAIVTNDIILMSAFGFAALAVLFIFWKEFKALSFDPDFTATLGFPVRLLDILLTGLIVVGIVIGLRTVGVVLMSSLLIAPAAAARQWTDRLGVMALLSALFGGVAGATGALLSAYTPDLPTGPVIVIAVSAIVLISLLFAPNRGLFGNWLRRQRNRGEIRMHTVLINLYDIAVNQHGGDYNHPHPAETLISMTYGKIGIRRTLNTLAYRDLVASEIKDNRTLWKLTAKGFEQSAALYRKQVGTEG